MWGEESAMTEVLEAVTAGRPMRQLRTPIAVTWEQCAEGCPGWGHYTTPPRAAGAVLRRLRPFLG